MSLYEFVKHSPQLQPAVSWVLLGIQVVLIVITAWFLPKWIKPSYHSILTYVGLWVVLWFGYALLTLYLDGALNIDTPGIGYLLIGFFPGLFGFARTLMRAYDSPPQPRA